jgi:hypothetical protein
MSPNPIHFMKSLRALPPRSDAMFKFVPDTNVPGFRVGVRDDVPGFRVRVADDVPGFSIDENGSVRRPLPAAPSTAVTAPTIFSPAGLSYQGNSGLFPMPYQAYVPVAGGSPSQDPLQQAVDRAANPYTNSGGLPVPDPLRQAVDRAANPYAYVGPPARTPPPPPWPIIGGLIGGLMGGALGGGLGSPFTGLIGGTIGAALGTYAPGVMSGPAGQSLGAATAAGATPGGL